MVFCVFLDIVPIGRLAYSQSKNQYNNKRCSTRSSNINSYSTIISRKCKKNIKKPISQKAFTGSTHCTTDFILGDVVGEWGIVFQYFSIIPMRKMMEGKQLSKKEGVKEADKAWHSFINNIWNRFIYLDVIDPTSIL